jgi:alpha-beta hydrolase superfamily lysophospholipase
MIFLGLILFSFSSFGVPEAEFVRIYEALDQKQIYTQKSFTSEDGVHIRYTRFGRVKGQQGAVVIAPGRTESSLKYLELAIDLIDQGFSPVYAIDHRGQGFSDRQLADAQKGYVRVFNDYVVDFSKFINLVRADVLVDTDRLFLITHSMGGVIGLRYSLLNPDVFQKMVLFSPMMKLPFESQILAGVNLLCADQKRCENYVPFGGPFDLFVLIGEIICG